MRKLEEALRKGLKEREEESIALDSTPNVEIENADVAGTDMCAVGDTEAKEKEHAKHRYPEVRIASAHSASAILKSRQSLPASQPQQLSMPSQARAPAPQAYVPYDVKAQYGTQAEFYESPTAYKIREVIVKVVEFEGPVSLGLCARRVAAHWGFRKVRKRALVQVRKLIPANEVTINIAAGREFLWPKRIDPKSYDSFRVSGNTPESFRDRADLPVQEGANAAYYLLKRNISAPEEELCRETSRLLGFRRTGPFVEKRMIEGVEYLLEKGTAVREGGMIVWGKK